MSLTAFCARAGRVVLSVAFLSALVACGEVNKPPEGFKLQTGPHSSMRNGGEHKRPPQNPSADSVQQQLLVSLGGQLFFDTNLSLHRNQSCATCHSPAAAFSDPTHQAVSLGSIEGKVGGRNTPTIAYSRFSPRFGLNAEGHPRGGQFWDGRARGLKAQASGPIFNPVEMALPRPKVLVERISENPHYVKTLTRAFGDEVLKRPERLVSAVADSLQAFEQTDTFSPFNSKYDRFLRGEEELTPQEELGRTLFFSQQFTNCNQCHQLARTSRSKREVFTNFTFHNIGVPKNPALDQPTDMGLAGNANFDQTVHPTHPHKNHHGKFKVPTLRNVELTAPYMHNGVFNDLKTVVQFYNKYNSRSVVAQTNPETGLPWGPAEVPESLSLKELEFGPALDEVRVDALVAFLKTLTDEPYRMAANAAQ
ncbi:MAG: cytochrome-c peroxidase [Pontibacterium sp.]